MSSKYLAMLVSRVAIGVLVVHSAVLWSQLTRYHCLSQVMLLLLLVTF